MRQTIDATPKRRWLRFSLRTLLIVVVLLSLALGWLAKEMVRAERQRTAVEAIREAGGWVYYDWEVKGSGSHTGGQESPVPALLVKLMGEDFFSDVAGVYLDRCADDETLGGLKVFPNIIVLKIDSCPISNAGLEHIKRMTQLKRLGLYGTKLPHKDVEELRKALPNCTIYRGQPSELPPAFRNPNTL